MFFKNNFAHKFLSSKLAITLVLFSLLNIVTGCEGKSSSDYIDRTSFYFDTVINIRIYDSSDESLLDDCMEIASKYDEMFSCENSSSDIYKINNSNGNATVVNDETIELLELALYYANLTNGAFNPLLGAVTNLWDFSGDDNSIPDADDIEKALTHTDYNLISIDSENNTVTISDADAKLDLGGIAKGYIADKIKEYLVESGVTSAIINLGGNVLLVGSKIDGSNFSVGVEKPFAGNTSYITTIEESDKSVVTSGVYERYFTIDGTLYHHILDPSTGYPVTNNLYGVTIISDSSADGDALSTAVFVLGLDEGSKLIESLDGISAIFVTNDYELHYAS